VTGPLHIRAARKSDASDIVILYDSAGYGVPLYFWKGMRKDESSVLEVARTRAMREEGAFSYRNIFVAEVDGNVAGMLLGYLIDDPYDLSGLDQATPMFRPLMEMEAMVPGSWYINILSTHAECRGRGVGAALLKKADALAAGAGAGLISVMIESGNEGAHRLYERHGFTEMARRPRLTFEGDYTKSAEWVLLTKPVSA
jgi:ribosomal protein S18 acetylase RimI-like enzyme